MTKPSKSRLGRRFIDFAAYVLIATLLGGALIWVAEQGNDNTPAQIGKWGGLLANTALLFGTFAGHYKQPWRNHIFWSAAALMLAVHLLGWVVILQRVEHWKSVWFLIMYPIETPVVIAVGERTVTQSTGKRRDP